MAGFVTDFAEEMRLAGRALLDFGENLSHPTVRLGITGLSGAGKTVFITALVRALTRGGSLPVFEAQNEGRIARATLAHQPDDAVPRFDYEQHLKALTADRRWPDSTTQISELRLKIDYQSRSGAMRELTVDIVDYPGEWLLDLPLLTKTYDQWAAETLAQSRNALRAPLARDWHAALAALSPDAPADEVAIIAAAEAFTRYLRACRDEKLAMSTLPPGRFLMPGDLAGSPALTFAPLDLGDGVHERPGSNAAVMRRRYDSYVRSVVRPFFRNHFARLDRQIVLVDALAALNAGPDALRDLETALTGILDCFQIGRRSLFGTLFRPRADRVLFAATKADHLHHESHDRLEAVLRRLVQRAIARAQFQGATVDVVALAAVRATREAELRLGAEMLPAIVGEPAGGGADVAVFPGQLPEDPDRLFAADAAAFQGLATGAAEAADYRFQKFRPPALVAQDDGAAGLPHIRLDRALQFLLGDRLT